MDEPATPAVPAASAPKISRVFAVALVLLALIVAALWFDTRGRIGSTQEELARRLRDIESESREARTLARQAQEGLRDAQAKIGALEAKLAESQNQQLALEALYQELARNRDEWQLAEIEQVLAIAQQQLQLSGNVRAALLALQLAEGRLSRADRPQFLPVRRALARDIERLKSLPLLDVPGLSLTLDRLVASVDALPLAFDERTERTERIERAERPAPAKGVNAAPPAPEEGFLRHLGGEVWRELRQLVVVRRIDAPEPPLLPPQQAYFLRENLKLRLLNARLALLTRDEAGYREDLRVAQGWIQRYFDARAKGSQAALAQLKQLSSASVSFEPPSIADSLEAVRSFKSRRERTS
jgi:uroporphyrin-3 C-methyltransferase